MKRYLPLLLMLSFSMLKAHLTNAQKKDTPHDTAYYETYPGTVTARIYATQKYASLNFPSDAQDLRYTANTKLGAGVGATYNNFTLNLAYGISKNDEKGKTKGFDFQLHLFPNKWAADLSLTSYKGSYISPKGYGATNDMSYYYRPEVKLDLFGLSVYRVPNAAKFSYRAAMVQNEWQKKSAGSVLYGGEIYYGALKGDSTLIPYKIANNFLQKDIKDIHFISIGPGIGYAYTAVAAKHLFLMGSLIGNLDINFSTEINDKDVNSNNKVSVEPLIIYKAVAGYNSSTWSVCAILAGNALLFKGSASDKAYYLSTGNYKLFIAKKIMCKHKNKT